MSYSSGILRYCVTIYNKRNLDKVKFGEKVKYEAVGCVHADVTWNKGVKALREGALDAYDTVMIRMRWNNIVNKFSLLECEGVTYQIQSLHADRMANTVQITATEMVGDVPVYTPEPKPAPNVGTNDKKQNKEL